MALENVTAGTKIVDEADANSLWIRIADKAGVGFAEAYPDAPEYNQYNSKFNSKGEPVAYLKGDKVKVPAHWATPGEVTSFWRLKQMFLRALLYMKCLRMAGLQVTIPDISNMSVMIQVDQALNLLLNS